MLLISEWCKNISDFNACFSLSLNFSLSNMIIFIREFKVTVTGTENRIGEPISVTFGIHITLIHFKEECMHFWLQKAVCLMLRLPL